MTHTTGGTGGTEQTRTDAAVDAVCDNSKDALDAMSEGEGAAFLAFPSTMQLLRQELAVRYRADTTGECCWGDLLYLPHFDDARLEGGVPWFCQCAMMRPVWLSVASITDAARKLKSVQCSWAHYATEGLWRRAALIQSKLPHVSLKPHTFPYTPPRSPIGLYCLLDTDRILCSPRTTSPFPVGRLEFAENHTDPPSRAYLKLQEALTLMSYLYGSPLPAVGTKCFEAGAAPGGWTWVLATLGAEVLAVDKAPLSPRVASLPCVRYLSHDAFTLPASEVAGYEWVLSDAACYPDRLLAWIKAVLEAGSKAAMVCTIKLTLARDKPLDWALLAEFEGLGGGRVVRLCYNKHELTFLRPPRP